MKLGVRAHDFGNVEKPAILAKRIAQVGFDCAQLAPQKAFELAGIKAPAPLSPQFSHSIKQAFDTANLEVSVYGCYVNLAMADESQHVRDIQTIKSAFAEAKKLGAPIVGTESSFGLLSPFQKLESKKQLFDACAEVLPAAEETGVTFGIEPDVTHTLCSSRLTRELLDAMKSPALKVIFDPQSFITPDKMEARVQADVFAECLQLFGDDICAVHIKDCKVAKDTERTGVFEMCKLGDGIVNVAGFLPQILKVMPDVPVLREGLVPSDLDDELAFLRRILENR